MDFDLPFERFKHNELENWYRVSKKNYTLLYTQDLKCFSEAQPTSNKNYNDVFSFA